MKNNSEIKLLSILCQGRNDAYMGNFKWRMATALNKLSRNIVVLGEEENVEILVSDWGSDQPLYRDLDLTQEARRIVKFLLVPPNIAKIYDKDAGFSMVHPINAVARRAWGKYYMFSDSDVYVPLESMAKLIHGLKIGYIGSYSLDESFFWSSRYNIPNSFIKNNPVFEDLESHIEKNWFNYIHDVVNKEKFLGTGVCLLMKRNIWIESTGWDEKLIYWGWNDIDLHRRLIFKYRWDDLEKHGIRMFHLEHYARRTKVQRKMNPMVEPTVFAPNPANWGLGNHSLPIVDGYGLPVDQKTGSSVSRSHANFNDQGNLISVKEIVRTNPLYKDVAANFLFDPHGFFSNSEPLIKILTELQPRSVCEIGSWLGSSARFFASFPFVEKVVCVDHWDRWRVENWTPGAHPERLMNNLFEQFLANCIHSNSQNKIFPVRLDSIAATNYFREQGNTFDLIYIDGEHSAIGVKRDIVNWFPMLAPAGLLCGDDWNWQKEPDNVAGAVSSFANERNWKVFYHDNFWLMLPVQTLERLPSTQFMKSLEPGGTLYPKSPIRRLLSSLTAIGFRIATLGRWVKR
jgi:hypothetical protein